jgi:membrane fusion protein (multidrug efflux system)
LLLVLALLSCSSKSKQAGPEAPVVEVITVEKKTVPEYAEHVGQTEAPNNVEIRARVEGFIQEILFQEGAEVKQGDLLFVIDPKPYQEKVANAQAQLAEAVASQGKAQRDVDRYTPLAKIQAIPRKDFDDAIAVNDQAKAAVMAARSVLANAELDLSYTRMSAPVAGKIGSTAVRVGSLVGRGDPTLLATISSQDPIWVSFTASETQFLAYTKAQMDKAHPMPDPKFDLFLADGSHWPYPGKINFVDRMIDTKTGTLKIRVEFPNPDKMLKPGLFARVRVTLRERPDALVIPQRAVQQIQDMNQVYVVGPDNKVSVRTVKLGGTAGALQIVDSGLEAGDRVIVEGLQKVRDGMTVETKEIPLEQAPK